MRDAARARERLVGVALAGALALNFPLLYLFGGKGTLLGIPVLFAYLFLVWAALIALVAVIVHAPPRDRRGGAGELDDGPPRV